MTNQGEIIADQFSDAVNTFSFDQEAFNQAMSRQHRTLQQSMMRATLGWIESIADKDDKFFDARNEGSKKIATELIKDFRTKHDGINPSQYLGFI